MSVFRPLAPARALFAALVLVAPLASCGGSEPKAGPPDGEGPTDPPPPPVPVSLRISPRDSNLPVGGTLRFAAEVRDSAGALVPSTQLRWVSRTTSVLQLDSMGLATAVAAGVARVVATHGTLADSTTATVMAPAPPADVTITVNTANRTPISRWIYGMNLTTEAAGAAPNAFPWYGAQPPASVPFDRFGGNRYSAYNWENNFSHAGADFQQQNDAFLSASRTPLEAVRSRVAASRQRGAGALVTVPMLGYVAADGNGPMPVTEAGLATRLAQRFRVSRATKNAPFTTSPDPNDGVVYQDEYVSALLAAFPGATTDANTPVMFTLDNEPDAWHHQFKAVLPDSADDPDRPRMQTYAQFLETTLTYARAVKAVAPNAVVFGGSFATWAGVLTMGRYPKPDPQYGSASFVEFYLAGLAAAQQREGKRLVDVLDIHWYPATGTNNGEITNDYAPQDAAMVTKRLQAPRSLWDPTYNEDSWVSGVTDGPVELIPRLRRMVDRLAPGTKLSFSEYYYGRSGDISGGIAQADVLGIFGREGVYSAAFWPQAGVYAPPYNGNGALAYAYVFGAFRNFLDYNGQGGRFGDTGLATSTSNAVETSAYGSLDASGRVVMVVINKAAVARTAEVILTPAATATSGYTQANTYVMRSGVPTPAFDRRYSVANGTVSLVLPPLSVSTVVISP